MQLKQKLKKYFSNWVELINIFVSENEFKFYKLLLINTTKVLIKIRLNTVCIGSLNQWSSQCAPVYTIMHGNYFTVHEKFCFIKKKSIVKVYNTN